MANEEAVRGHRAEHVRVWIASFVFGRLQCRHLRRPATLMMQVNIADLQIGDWMVGDAADDCRVFRCRVIADDVAEDYPAAVTDRNSSRATHTTAEPNKDRSFGDIAHGDVGEGYVFEQCAVFAFERNAVATFKDTV